MVITFTDKNSRTCTLDLDTATKTDLESVPDPRALGEVQKRAFFARQSGLLGEERLTIVTRHENRIRKIFEQLRARAIGPESDSVHAKLALAEIQFLGILTIWKGKAVKGGKDFSELNLVAALKAVFADLNAHIDDLQGSATREHLAALVKARNQVGDALARAEAGVRARVNTATIKYRGSLATGWRNAEKSVDNTAQRINLLIFDADAFIEIPAVVWADWVARKIVTEKEKKGKEGLIDLIIRAKWEFKKADEAVDRNADEVTLLKRILDQLLGIQQVEERLRDAMRSVSGYKMVGPPENPQADFGFVLQSSEKSARELVSGNLYPLDEIAKAGLPLTENRLELFVADGTVCVKMPEHHMSMSAPITGKTYPGDIPDAPHSSTRPTEAMVVKEFFGADPETRRAAFLAAGKIKAAARQI